MNVNGTLHYIDLNELSKYNITWSPDCPPDWPNELEQQNKTKWECLEKIFTSLESICKETKLILISGPYGKGILRKFNYTILFMKYYIYTSKMHNQAIYLSVFVNKSLSKYRIESFSQWLRKNAPRKSVQTYRLLVKLYIREMLMLVLFKPLYNIDRTLRALWLVKNLCFIRYKT